MTSSSSPSEEGRPGFDFATQIFSALRYASHLRLMLVCFAIGILAGLAYFACGQPMYYSRALIRLTVLQIPVNSDSGISDSAAASSMFAARAFQRQLLSDLIQKQVAIKLGVATARDSPEGIRSSAFQRVDITFVDAGHMEVAIFSPYPLVVREYARTLIEVYEETVKAQRDEFRKKALDSYLAEMDDYAKKLDQHLQQRQKFEQSSSLAQIFIQNNSLSQVPKDIVMTKDRLRRMTEMQDYIRNRASETDTVAQLSLLNAVRSEKPVDVGTVFREGVGGTIQNMQPRAPQNPVDIVVAPSMVQSLEPWQLLEKEQHEILEEIRRKSELYQPGHAVMRQLETRLDTVKDKLKAELQVATQRFNLELASVTEKLKSLEGKLPEYNEITAKYEKFQQDYGLMERGQLNWAKAHTDMAMNVAKLEFGADRDRIFVEYESMVALRDTNPVSPNKSKLVLMAFGFGLALSMGVPTLLMFADSTVNRLEQLETHTGLKGLGVIPLTDSATLEDIFRSPVLESHVPSFLLENFRIVRNNLSPSGKADGSQVLMITSARPGEGKTSLAANLAWSFHTMGEKTLLVDCDLRRGRVAVVTRSSNLVGMSKLLTGEASSKDAILATERAGLDVIPRGPIISGATELLCQHQFEDLINQWRGQYDRIILDTPPVLGLGETSGIQRVADGVILVVRAHKTRTKDVSDAVEMLHRAGANLFGFVLNAVDLSKMANHYNYYYYSPQYYQALEGQPAPV